MTAGFSLQQAIKPAVIDRRYSGKMVENVSELLTVECSHYFLASGAQTGARLRS